MAAQDSKRHAAATVTTTARTKLSAYDLVIGTLALFSLVILLLLIFAPLSASTKDLLNVVEDGLCVIFLLDFFRSLYRAPRRWGYFLGGGGWLDLLGSIPFSAFAIFRIARLFRIVRVLRTLRGSDYRVMLMGHLAENTLLFTLAAAMILVFVIAAIVTWAEAGAPNSNIKTYPEAVWWGFVTICTVGYGDYYPVTTVGRISAVFLMFCGIGVIGVLASYLSTTFISLESRHAARYRARKTPPAGQADEDGAKDPDEETAKDPDEDMAKVDATAANGDTELAAIKKELVANREELTALRKLIEQRR